MRKSQSGTWREKNLTKTNELFKQRKRSLITLQKIRRNEIQKAEDTVCPKCENHIKEVVLKQNNMVCPFCDHYFSMTPERRINMIADTGSFRELNENLVSRDPLGFPDYDKKLVDLREKNGENDAIITGSCKINGIKCCIGVLDSNFLMGSMGTVVGEKIALLAEYAGRKKLPLLIFSASGGARMQEGLFSLMQMAKTSAAIERYKNSGGFFISCLTNPTTGGVSASYANLGDIIMAEPNALICFAGPRVIEQTIGEKLPEGFQHSEFLLEHGMLDMIVTRYEMKDVLFRLLRIHEDR